MTDPTPSRPNLRFARGELVFGYRLVRKLGEGSFGSVWLAANEKGFEWALKIVNLGGSGGQKEFKALQLIKDRKINNTSLLKLIDYGLLDRDGTSLAATAHKPAPSPPVEATPDLAASSDGDAPGKSAGPQGTMMPLAENMMPLAEQAPVSRQTFVEKLAARETQRDAVSGDTTSDDQPRAAWLVIVMEVGQLTLHQLQMKATEKDFENNPRKQTRAVTRMGVTAAGSKGSKAQGTVKGTTVDPVEEPLVPLPVAQVLPYIEQAARGLDYLHRHEIVHRDIKPQNIILVGDDAKVCDYGLASEIRPSATATTIGCTPAYAAPEAINNRPVYASDQYSLAVTYIELVTGRWPFFGVTQTAIYREKDEGKHNLTFISNPAVRVVLKKALSKLPRDRYPSCVAFVEQLKIAESTRVVFPRWLQVSVAAMLLVLVGALVVGFAGPSIWEAVATARKPVEKPPDRPLVQPPENPPEGSPENPGENPPVKPPEAPPTAPAPTDAELAEKNLKAAFAEKGPPPAEALDVFETWILKSERQDFWWSELTTQAALPDWQPAMEKWLLANRARNDYPDWLKHPQYDSLETQQKAASLQRLLHLPKMSPEAVRRTNAFKLNDSNSIAKLVELDLQMRSKEDAVTADDWVKWDGRIESALKQELAETEQEQLQQFAKYLRCQRLGPENTPAEFKAAGTDLIELLDTEPHPTWLDLERRKRLAIPLGYVALNELGKTDADLPAIDKFGLHNHRSFNRFLDLAAANELDGGPIDAARALLRASQTLASQPPIANAVGWQSMEQLAWNGLNHRPTNDLLWNQRKRQLLAYVATYAALRTNNPGSEKFASAVKNLVRILLAKTTENAKERALYFHFTDESQPQDAGVYQHLVQPVLEHSGLKSEAIATIDPGALATLWGVRGTLLRRSPSAVAFVPPTADTTLSQPIQKLLLQYRAFQEAKKYDTLACSKTGAAANQDFVNGANRVLAGLPRQDESLNYSLADLIALVKEFDPQGSTNNAELLRLGAYVHLQQAAVDRVPASRKRFLEQAARRYDRLAALNLPADNRHHLAVANERLSELHFSLSQLTELDVADYEFTATQMTPPALNSKSYHLWQAKKYAERAIDLASRPQKENAYLLLANAQEQMAEVLGQLEQYDQALETLKNGEAAAAERSTSRLQSLRGRCELRQGLELFSGLAKDDRVKKLNAAITSLTNSLGNRRESGNYEPQDAETLFSIAEAQLRLAYETPAEKVERWKLARVDLQNAYAAASKDSPRIGHYRWRLLVLLAQQGIGTSSDPSRQGKDLAEVILKDVVADPSGYDPVALFGIADQAGWLHYDKANYRRSWLPPSGPLAMHWRSSDTARLEAVRLSCEAALANNYDQSVLTSARQLKDGMTEGSDAQRTAEALLQDCTARYRCEMWKKPKSNSSAGGATEKKETDTRAAQQAQADAALRSIQESYDEYLESLDSHIRPLALTLQAASLDQIYADGVLTKLTVLEKRALWRYATAAPTPATRKEFYEVCMSAGAGGSGSPMAPALLDSKKLAQDLLKPILFFDDLQDRDPRLGELVKFYKPPPPPEDKTKTKAPR